MPAMMAGADLGNDSLKLVFDAKTHYTIKNTVSRRLLNEVRKNLNIDSSEPEPENTDEIRKRTVQNLDVIIRPLGGQEERYFIGDLAIQAGENETIVGTQKADNPHIHIPLLAMLALHTPRNRREGRYNIVCGLPIKQFNKESSKKMQEKLIGQFDVTFIDEKGELGRKVKVTIENAIVAPEGVPVLMNRMLNSDATDFARPELRNGSYGIIDIGAFTTDIPVIINGKPDSIASDGLEEGIASYLDRIVEALRSSTRAEITRNQVLNKIVNDDYTLLIRGKNYDLKKEIEDQLNLFAQKVIDVIDRLWSKNYEIKEFFVVGGGGKLLKPYLQKIARDRDINLTYIEMKNERDYQNDPQLQNAFGYWKIAKQKYGA